MKDNLNILHITSNLKKNGPALVVFDVAAGQKELEHNVFVAGAYGELADLLSNNGVEYINIPIGRSNSNVKIKRIFNYIKDAKITYKKLVKLVKQEEIDIINSHQPVSNIFAKIISRRCKIPFVTTSHNVYSKNWINKTYVSGDKVIAVSDKVLKNSINNFNVPQSKIVCIKNGINPNRLQVTEQEQIGKGFIIGTIAGLRKQKSLDIMIKAFSEFSKKVSESTLVICGEGEELDYLKKIVSECKIEKKVLFLGFRSDVANIINSFDVFTLSSNYEGLPISMLEAMALGKPVVVTRVGGIPEVIHNRQNGILVEPNDYYSLANAYFELYSNKAFRVSLGQKSKETIDKEYGYIEMANQYVKVYNTLIN